MATGQLLLVLCAFLNAFHLCRFVFRPPLASGRHVDDSRRLSVVAAPGGPFSATVLWSIAAISIGAANRPAELLPASSCHRRGNGQRSTDASCEARSRTLRPQRFSDRLWRKRREPEHCRRHRESRNPALHHVFRSKTN